MQITENHTLAHPAVYSPDPLYLGSGDYVVHREQLTIFGGGGFKLRSFKGGRDIITYHRILEYWMWITPQNRGSEL